MFGGEDDDDWESQKSDTKQIYSRNSINWDTFLARMVMIRDDWSYVESVEIDAWLETDSSMDCTVMGKLDSERELLVNPK